MRFTILLGLLIHGYALANSKCEIDLGVYVSDDEYSTDSKCAYLVTNFSEDDSCGASVSFIHDPRFLPKHECKSNGITKYPIGISPLNASSFIDLRTDRLFKYYGFSNISHDDL